MLEADQSNNLYWWVDGVFANHDDMWSHTGGAPSLGQGVVYETSMCQKLNMQSSTEAKLVVVDDCMGQILWKRYFFEAQGYQVDDAIGYLRKWSWVEW